MHLVGDKLQPFLEAVAQGKTQGRPSLHAPPRPQHPAANSRHLGHSDAHSHAQTHTHTRTHTHTHTHTHTRTNPHTHKHTRAHVHTHVRVYARKHTAPVRGSRRAVR